MIPDMKDPASFPVTETPKPVNALDAFAEARKLLDSERMTLEASRKANDERHKSERARIDVRLEEIQIALHGPKRTRKPKVTT